MAAQPGSAGLKPNSETTVSQNLLRDGWDQNEPGLSPAVVRGGKFGQLFATKVTGQVFAQPLVVDNPATASSDVIVATEDDWVYRLDGATGHVLKSTQLGTWWSYTVNGCKNIWPDIGITSTPVYDPSTGIVYVVAVVTNGNPTVTTPTVELFALNEQTLAVEWSKSISGTAVNDPKQKFNAAWERQRAGLLLMNGWIYAAFGSYCDGGTYSGFISGVNVANQGKSSTLWSDEAGSPDANPQAGIWQSGSGLMSDGPGRIFFASGNGTSPPPGPGGSHTPTELGDAVARLAVGSDGSLSPADFFSPANAPSMDANDVDFGSGGPVGLPFGTSTYPHLLVQAGKDGRVFLLNRDSLGGRQQGPNGTDKPVSMSGPFGGQWSHPAAFAGVNPDGTAADYVYVVGKNDYLRALKLTGSSAAPALTDVGNSPGWFGDDSGAPVVTSNGADPSSAIVWAVDSNNGANDQLEAFDAIPGNGTLKEIWSGPIGSSHFAAPATDDDRIYVGSKDDGTGTDLAHGVVYGFGASNQMPLLAPQVNFEDVGVTAPATGKTLDATATATEPMQVTGITAPTSPLFTLGTPSVMSPGGGTTPVSGFPVPLQAGQQLIVPVTFTPTAAGAVSDSIQLATL